MPTRVCNTCLKEKDLEKDFLVSNGKFRQRRCKDCQRPRSNARSDKYRSSHTERYKKMGAERYRLLRKEKYISFALKKAKERSINKGLDFQFTYNYCMELMVSNDWSCSLSGLSFQFESSKPGIASPYSPSIDRINPSLGYVEGNVRFILHGLNSLKGSGTDDDVLSICKAVLKKNYGF